MPISKTEKDRQRQAAADLAAKLQLEIAFVKTLRTFFKAVRADFRSHYANNRQIISAKEYEDEMVALLKAQYRRVATRFSNRLAQDITKNYRGFELKEGEKEAVATAITALIASRALEQAGYIMNTTQAEIDSAVAVILADVAIEGPTPSDSVIASRIEQRLRRQQTARSDVIAATEVNAMAEKAKYTEFVALADAGVEIDGVSLKEGVVKRWDAILDEKTRINHAVADGQRREVNEPFDVGGQQLMQPGDTSLGASLDNIINCRCSVQYVTGKPTVL